MNWTLITGATSDLGQALARKLSEKGHALLLTAPNHEKLKTLAASLSTETRIQEADLTCSEDRKKVMELIDTYCPTLAINNAGCGLYGPLLYHSREEQLQILELNSHALLDLNYAALKTLQCKMQPGKILNISSVAATFPYPYFSVYSASKAFVTHLSKALDAEYKSQGIRVLCACPGQIKTAFREKASKGFFREKTRLTLSVDKVVQALIKQIEKGKASTVIDARYRLLLLILRMLPPIFRHWIFKRSLKKRVASYGTVASWKNIV